MQCVSPAVPRTSPASPVSLPLDLLSCYSVVCMHRLTTCRARCADPDKSEIELVRAKTMHQMVNVIPGENIKVMYLTNQQANLIASDTANIMKMLNAFEVNPNSQLVIRFLPTSGASHSLESGILPGFKHLFSKDGTTRLSYETHPEEYTEAWKDLLKVQAKNNEKAGIGADFLPIPPYTAFEGQGESEWGLECFMREVLVPLAAETQAMVIGSGFKDDSMMMMFAKVADALSSKYGGVTSVPWTTFGFADAPSLAMACCEPSSSAYAVFKQCPAWQLKYKRVLKAKILMKRKAQQGAGERPLTFLPENSAVWVFCMYCGCMRQHARERARSK